MIGNRVRLLLLSGTAAVASIGTAHAQTAGTTAGTTINNTAAVSYTVNGTPQTTNSTTASFVVDRKVNFTVIRDQPGNTQVNLGQTGAVMAFKVTNTTNGTQDFLLDPDQATIATGLIPGTDNFDMLNLRAYVDANGNGVYDPGVDTAQFVDELAPNASVEVFLVGNVPTTASATQANVSLHVTVAAGGQAGTQGAALVPTDLNLGNADNVVDVVFADDDDDNIGADVARNGQGRAYGAFEVATHNVALTVTKTALVLSDGVNTINPKALPGAVVQYCLLANNATLLTPATGVTLTDVIPANTTYVAGSIAIGLPGGTCTLAGAPQDDATSFNAATKTVTATIGTLAGGASTAVSFRVTIN
ncbi:hypothetical protein [uncultured Sphingomonas sp.]|uniref:hypothetical protein n=1 Tax=uncultured Sphingomonas sp. TaxID=158754 RepID=UPI0035CA53E2